MYLCAKLSEPVLVKKVLLIVNMMLLFTLAGKAQYANGWINYGQQYFKIPIAKDGIYRLSYTNLSTAGFPVDSVDPRQIQLYHRGTEQAIFVQGEADAVFNTTDYLEFYGQRNDGTLDSLLYQPSSLRPHPYYNLYSDTAAYFLTYSQVATAGKRMGSFVQNNVTGITKEAAHSNQVLSVYTAEYSGGNTLSNGEIQSSAFDEGEGWTDNFICTVNSGCTGLKDYPVINLLGAVTTSGNPSLDLLIVGRDQLNHQTQVYVGPTTSSLRLLSTQTFFDFQKQRVTSDLNWSDIGADGKMIVEVRALGVGGIRDKISVSYVKITLPQNFDFTGLTKKVFNLGVTADASGKSYVEITSPPAGLRLWDVTDPDNLVIIGTSTNAGVQSAVIANTTQKRSLLASTEINTPAVRPISFQQFNPASFNFLVLTHPSLLGAAQSYADYRASTAGGSYSTLTITIDQVFNQFGYGEISPLAVFNLMKYLVEQGQPKYFFIVGKGLDVSQGFYRKTSFLATDFKDLVPTAGLPASDMAFSTQLKGSGYVPTVATGRLSASTSVQVFAYLSKIKEIESTPLNALWHKEGLHLSGGIEDFELTEFRSYMDEFKTIAEGPYWGGQITTIAKHDPSAVKQINISDQVNAGVNLITFFGHSSPGTIDIDIGKVSDPKLGYNNPGKYPVFLINGCNAGNFFANGTSFGEDWMLSGGKGARGFIAHSFFGFVQNLKSYSDIFYSVGFADSSFIHRGLGDVQVETAARYLQQYGPDIANITQIQQMVLLGDPAVKLFGTIKPDYETDDTAISLASFDGSPVTAASDSFAVHVIARNYGAVNQKPFAVRLVRTFSDNTTTEYDRIIPPIFTQDTLTFIIKKDRSTGFGSNQFTFTLDYTNQIAELNENNNTGTTSFVIPLGGTQNLFPIPYAIVNQQATDFIFQSVGQNAVTRAFQFQLDTVNTFDSPYLIQQKVSGKVLAKLSLNLQSSDSTVYYWRTKFDQPQANESTLWTTSSFSLIKNSPVGWRQKKFPQLNENEFNGIVSDVASGKLKFQETSANLLVTTYGLGNPASYLDVSVKINNAEFNLATEGDPCRNNTINFISFNKTSLVPYPALNLGFQSVNTCGREPQVINSFTLGEMDNGSDHDVLAMIDNIQPSDSVLIFSIGDVGYASWSTAMKTKLRELGIDDAQLSALQPGDPLVVLGRKDAPAGTAKVFEAATAPASQQQLQVAKTITGRFTAGQMNSVLIGPALKWKQLVAKASGVQTSDVYSFVLYGLNSLGDQTLLQNNVTGTFDLSTVDANVYPYLRLEMHAEDDTNLTPVQLSQWLVLYDPVAEGVLLLDGPATQQTLSEGQPWIGNYKFVNISPQVFSDSLTVNFEVLNKLRLQKELSNFKIHAPAPGDTTKFTVSTATIGKSGLNDVDVFVNPKILIEQYYENNVIALTDYLNIQADKVAPVLDVTFDGRHLVNGDFVSPEPTITIRIRDENKFLFKTDTTGISVIMTYPCDIGDCPAQPIYFSRRDMQWTPSSSTADFLITFKPQHLVDGAYSLFVEAADASGNKSGATPYEIDFLVKNDLTFSFTSVYPNPSQAGFYFNFSLTGDQTPDAFFLNIYSFDGRRLQEYSVRDLADFHIGQNQLVWDPKDNGGSALPSGMYIYKISVSVSGQTYVCTGKLILVH